MALLGENREHLLLLFVGSESFVTSCLISSEHVFDRDSGSVTWNRAQDEAQHAQKAGETRDNAKLCVCVSSKSHTNEIE